MTSEWEFLKSELWTLRHITNNFTIFFRQSKVTTVSSHIFPIVESGEKAIRKRKEEREFYHESNIFISSRDAS